MPQTPATKEEQILAMLLETAPTLGEAFRQIRILRSYLEYRFYVTSSEAPNTLEVYCRERSISPEDTAILTSWGEKLFTLFESNNAYKLLNNVSEVIKSLPAVRLYVPVKLDREHEVGILTWFRTNVHANMLLDVRIDPERVGGCAFAWKGIYRDYSLHRYIEENREALLAAISQYADNANTATSA